MSHAEIIGPIAAQSMYVGCFASQAEAEEGYQRVCMARYLARKETT